MLTFRKRILFITGLCILACPVPPVEGQTQRDEVRTDLGSALRIVRPLVRDDPERAISMLRRLKDEYPTHTRIYILLGETYQVIGQTDSARVVYEQCLVIDPNSQQAGASLGMLYVQTGETKKGKKIFDALLARTQYSIGSYRSIGLTLSRHGFYDLALDFYEEGREKNNGNYILTLDIAYLQMTIGNYEAAFGEYLYLIETTPKQHRLAQTKIIELLRQQPEQGDRLLEVLEEDGERDAPYREYVMAVLAIAYLERNMLESALDMALRADAPGRTDGTVVFNLADRVIAEYKREPIGANTRYFDLGLRALEAYITTYPTAPQIPRAKLMYVDLLMDLSSGKVVGATAMPAQTAVDRSLETLDWIILSYPGSEYAEQAYLKKGDIVFNLQKSPDEALAIYKDGMRLSRFYPTSFAERLGRVYLVIDEYDEAEKYFARLVESRSEELHETGVYYSGLMLSFERQYETARDTLTALAEKNPSSVYTNDAIELAWMIEEGLQGEQKNLHRFVDALKSELAGDTTLVIEKLSTLVELPVETPLRSRALIMLGEKYQGLGDYDEALRMYEMFLADYAKDIRAPDVRRKIAQVYEHGLGQTETALETYEAILVVYPHYIFLDEIRRDVTRIRESMGEQ